jgi:hypothetical protein
MTAFAAMAIAGATALRANSAFPDEFSIHFPANSPHAIFIGANFGLLVSQDGGTSWRYACEPWVVAGSNAALAFANVSLYDVTADDVLLAAVYQISKVTRSADQACTWPDSSGSIAGQPVSDLFPDPNDASLVLAVVQASKNGLPDGNYIVASHDGGSTFDAPHLYDTPSPTDLLTGIEIARSKRGVFYATLESTSGGRAQFLTSSDFGSTWTASPLPIDTTTEPRILTVDPEDEKKVYLRVISSALSDGILFTGDGGQTFTNILSIDGQLSSFLRAGDGAIYAGTRAGKLYVRKAGATNPADFMVQGAPHLRCLGQRRGTARIYACADMVVDGYSLVSSDDNAMTFQPVMTFRDLLGPLTCAPVQTNCQAHWQRIQGVLGIGAGADAGQPGGQPSSGGSNCGSVGTGGSALLLLLAFSLRRSTGARAVHTPTNCGSPRRRQPPPSCHDAASLDILSQHLAASHAAPEERR